MELNRTHQFLVYHDVNLLIKNINTIMKKNGALLDINNEISVEIRMFICLAPKCRTKW